MAGAPAVPGLNTASASKTRSQRGQLALVVRRRTNVDDQHERAELGSRYWPDRPADAAWDPYLTTSSGIQMRGGRLWKLDKQERNPPNLPPGMMGHPEQRGHSMGDQEHRDREHHGMETADDT